MDKWFLLLKKMRKYAKAKGYYKITGYTNVERIEQLVKTIGGKIDFKLIELEV